MLRRKMEKLDDGECRVFESDSWIRPSTKENVIQISNLSISEDDDEDVIFIAEQEGVVVACRDYPHPRHICAQFPFAKTPHDEHCQKCYCYICEEVAPCKSWTNGDHSGGGHCHATDHDLIWKLEKALSRIIHPAEPNLPATPAALDRYRLAVCISPTTTATPNYAGDKPADEDQEYLTYIGGILYDENKNWEFVTGYGIKICNKMYPDPDIQFYVALQKGLELAWSIGIRKLCLDLDSTCYNTIRRHFDVGREILHYEVVSEEEEQTIHPWNHFIENTSTGGGDLYGILQDVQDCLNRGWSVSARLIAPSKILQEPNAYALVKLAEVQRGRMQVYDFSSSDSLKQLVQSLADQYIRSCLN